MTARRQRAERRGHRAETIALLYLMCKGYLPVARRYKTVGGEIDLIVRRGRRLRFVEVKARATRAQAAEAVHIKNQQRVVRAAQYFLMAHPHYADYEMAFDVCLVPWYSWPAHIPHAFTSHS